MGHWAAMPNDRHGPEATGEVDPAARPYDATSFWDARLRSRFDLSGAGFRGLGVPFNAALYRQREIVLRRAIRRFRLPIRGADVVELGPGTGFYVERWRAWEVGSLLGLDITSVVPERLAVSFPEFRFAQADIADRWPAADASADLIAAFDVLFHIVDDARFSAAIREIGRVLRPDGRVLISDVFLRRRPFHGYHQVIRTLDDYRASLDAAGLEIVGRLPIFVTMHPALDLPEGWPSRLGAAWWTRLEAALVANPRRGRRLGSLLFWVDRALTARLPWGPSTELLVARRR